jgi:hypothetical protein
VAKVPREPEWLWKRFYGTDPGGEVTLLWEGRHLAIIRTGGGMCWSGIGCKSYHRSRTEAIYKDRNVRLGALGGSDARLDERVPPLEGRTKRADVAAMTALAKQLDAELEAAPVPPPVPQPSVGPLKEFTVVFQAEMKVKAKDRADAEASARKRILSVSRLDYRVVDVEEATNGGANG